MMLKARQLFFFAGVVVLACCSSLPHVCNYGEYVEQPFNDTECKLCPEGKYRDTVIWNVKCKDCAPGQSSGEGSISCVNITSSAAGDSTATETQTSVAAVGGVGVAAGATIGVVYYSTST